MKNKEWVDQWRVNYNSYLETPEWKAKRLLVLARDGGKCQAQMNGCRIVASEIHHAHGYELQTDTPLFQLVSICRPCHWKITQAARSGKAKRSDLAEIWHQRLKQSGGSGCGE